MYSIPRGTTFVSKIFVSVEISSLVPKSGSSAVLAATGFFSMTFLTDFEDLKSHFYFRLNFREMSLSPYTNFLKTFSLNFGTFSFQSTVEHIFSLPIPLHAPRRNR